MIQMICERLWNTLSQGMPGAAVFSAAMTVLYAAAGRGKRKKGELCPAALIFLNIYYILDLTILSRGINTCDPFEKVFSGWRAERYGTYTWDLDCIYNLFLFFPLMVSVTWRKSMLAVKSSVFRDLLSSVKAGAALSLAIETTQALLRAGTFQLSDLFYNTLGGVLGTALFRLILLVAPAGNRTGEKKTGA